MALRILFILLTARSVTAGTDTIDNGLSSDPSVECSTDSLTVNFATQKEFEGHVYVKGHYDDNACRADATLTHAINFTVPFTSCDVRRQRSSNPKGLYVSVTVIITFHPMFITKVDKSYNVQCFYTEIDKTVTNQLDVSQLATDVISQSVPLPICRYAVLMDGQNGSPVKFATVGQTVYHQWTCEPDPASDGNLFCATVHSCNVRDESGKEVNILDENGCAVDKFLLNNLEYTSDLQGGQLSQVFKFADQPSLFFQCQIRLSLKEGDSCKRSSDSCPAALRGKRSPDEEKTEDGHEVDVFSQSMTVFEIDDPITPSAAHDLGESAWQRHSLCVSPITFGLLIALLASVLLVSAIIIVLMCCRANTVKVKMSG